MMKGIIYYTNNKCDDQIAITVRKLLSKVELPIVSVSHKPLLNFGENKVVNFKSGTVSMFKQILIALKMSKADTIFCCEHDVLYHKSHFDFTPPSNDKYYFNTNVWTVDADTGKALWYDNPKHIGRRMTSGLVANRDLLIDHYQRKLDLISIRGKFSHREMGFAPGKIDTCGWEVYQSEYPNIDIKHNHNITKGRFDLSKFRCRESIKDSWRLESEVPGWGNTEGRFDSFLEDVFYATYT
jgi:hypothetical protein